MRVPRTAVLLLIGLSSHLNELEGSVRASKWHSLTFTLTAWVRRYTEEHGGVLPPTFAEAVPQPVREDIERNTGTSFESLVIYLPAGNLRSPNNSSDIIALLSFPVQETEKGPPSRYVIARSRDGVYQAEWFPEPEIRIAASKAGIELPQAATVAGLRPSREFEQAETLIEEAVRVYHVPEKVALKKLERYIDEQRSRGQALAGSWKDVADAVDHMPPPSGRAADAGPSKPARFTAAAEAPESHQLRSSWIIASAFGLACIAVGITILVRRRRGEW